MDVRQAWREKLALNLLIWFICACAVLLCWALIICPAEHIFNTAELALHSATLGPNNVYTSIRGEVFDLSMVAAMHNRIVTVVLARSILKYAPADNIFPVQACAPHQS